jgi:hypothetical protein
VNEILTDEQERLIEVLCQGIGDAIAKVEPGGMARTSSEPAMCFSRNLRLLDR